MEAILEFLFTLVIEIVNAMKFKKAKTRTRAITVIFVLLVGILTAVPSGGAVGFFFQGNMVGAVVMGVIALTFIAFGAIIIVRGHKTNWEKY